MRKWPRDRVGRQMSWRAGRWARAQVDEATADHAEHVRVIPTSVPVFDYETARPANEVEHWLRHSAGFLDHARERERRRTGRTDEVGSE